MLTSASIKVNSHKKNFDVIGVEEKSSCGRFELVVDTVGVASAVESKAVEVRTTGEDSEKQVLPTKSSKYVRARNSSWNTYCLPEDAGGLAR